MLNKMQEIHVVPWSSTTTMIVILRRRHMMWIGAKSVAGLRGFINGWVTATHKFGTYNGGLSEFEE